jgi:lipid-A-disaccharide synthase
MKRIFFIAGEASGDSHAAEVIRELKLLEPESEVHAYGGNRMEEIGAVIHYPLTSLASVGLDWMKSVFEFIRLGHRVPVLCQELGIKTLVLVDFPGFNLRVAALARKAGIRVLYYITPQVWAWRMRRIKRMRRDLDRALVIFPFEETFLRERGVSSRFVGHPLVDRLSHPRSSAVIREEHGLPLNQDSHLIGLLPGSRPSEVERLSPILVETARLLLEKEPDLHFVVPCAGTIPPQKLHDLIGDSIPWTLVEHPSADLRSVLRVSITKSGTSTLENAILGVPQVIVYKVKPLDAWIARHVIQVPWLGIVNILAGREICKEYLQEDCTPGNIAEGVLPLIGESEIRYKMLEDLDQVKHSLGEGHAASRAATAIQERWI